MRVVCSAVHEYSDWEGESTYRVQTILYSWRQHLELSRHVSQSGREAGRARLAAYRYARRTGIRDLALDKQ